jgi:hypothetical protein
MILTSRPATTGPAGGRLATTTRWSLRLVATVQLATVVAQPVLAGRYLTGDVDAIAAHGTNAMVTGVATFTLTALAALHAWLGGGSWRLALAALGLSAMVGEQIHSGFVDALAIHVPLGVAVVACSVLVAARVWTSDGPEAGPPAVEPDDDPAGVVGAGVGRGPAADDDGPEAGR